MNLFNKSFFRFTVGFLGILIVSFVLTIAVSHFGKGNKAAAVQTATEKGVIDTTNNTSQ